MCSLPSVLTTQNCPVSKLNMLASSLPLLTSTEQNEERKTNKAHWYCPEKKGHSVWIQRNTNPAAQTPRLRAPQSLSWVAPCACLRAYAEPRPNLTIRSQEHQAVGRARTPRPRKPNLRIERGCGGKPGLRTDAGEADAAALACVGGGSVAPLLLESHGWPSIRWRWRRRGFEGGSRVWGFGEEKTREMAEGGRREMGNCCGVPTS